MRLSQLGHIPNPLRCFNCQRFDIETLAAGHHLPQRWSGMKVLIASVQRSVLTGEHTFTPSRNCSAWKQDPSGASLLLIAEKISREYLPHREVTNPIQIKKDNISTHQSALKPSATPKTTSVDAELLPRRFSSVEKALLTISGIDADEMSSYLYQKRMPWSMTCRSKIYLSVSPPHSFPQTWKRAATKQTLWQSAPICRWFRQAWYDKSTDTSAVGLQDYASGTLKQARTVVCLLLLEKGPLFRELSIPLEVAASPAPGDKGQPCTYLTDSPFYETVILDVQTVSKLLSYSRNIRLFKRLCLAPIRYKTANGAIIHTSIRVHCPEIIAITSISSASKKSRHPSPPRSCHHLSPKSCFFFSQNLSPLLRQALSLLIPKIRCRQAFIAQSFSKSLFSIGKA
ncbi:hypothetical protein AVEN_275206-1 [Araneus ventricosus]|uniref:Uncharacterized protein n=1 Tax=Araneus ventricosus TaxID=182803 RepID=A0A4Y2NLW4_ARAVE|nr:hypothetical protein AVEN_275206-1 [Araneus ventricosus]